MSTASEDKPEGVGSSSLEGWLYQFDISISAALDLMLVKRRTERIQLEPASAEDAEAELDAPRVQSEVSTGPNELLVIQAKLRRVTQWTEAAIRALINHGTRRASAKDRLAKNPQVRYPKSPRRAGRLQSPGQH